MSWNVNGLSDSKILLNNTLDYLLGFDVVCLTETWRTGWDDRNLPGFSTAFIPANEEGRAGEGILVAVKRNCQYHVTDWGSDESSLWVKIDGKGLCTPVVLGCCYLPPYGSPQLRMMDIGSRFEELSTKVTASKF